MMEDRMRHFKGKSGSTWAIDLNYAMIQRVKRETEVDLLAILGRPDDLGVIGDDNMKLVDVLLAFIEPEKHDQFLNDLDGDAIESGWECILQELVDFSPSRRRPLLRTLLEKSKEAETRLVSKAEEILNERLENELTSIEASFLSSLESSGSTPTPSPPES